MYIPANREDAGAGDCKKALRGDQVKHVAYNCNHMSIFVFLLGIICLSCGFTMVYHSFRAKQHPSDAVRKSSGAIIFGDANLDLYDDIGKQHIKTARKWLYATWVVAVLGGLTCVALSPYS
jgi:hypothetical protein